MTAADKPNLDEASRAAVAALTYRLRERDAMAEADRPDAEVFGLEFMTALRGQGWRPTPAMAVKDRWRADRSSPPATTEAKDAFRTELEQQSWYRKAHPELDDQEPAS